MSISTHLFPLTLLLVGFYGPHYFTAAEQLFTTMKWPVPIIIKEEINISNVVFVIFLFDHELIERISKKLESLD